MFVDYRHVTRAVCAAALTILWSRPAIGQPAPEQDTSGLLRRLSLDDAVALALENNLDIRVERLNPQIQDVEIADARSAWAPTFATGYTRISQDTPSSSQLAGGANAVLNDTWDKSNSLNQRPPWFGGRYTDLAFPSAIRSAGAAPTRAWREQPAFALSLSTFSQACSDREI